MRLRSSRSLALASLLSYSALATLAACSGSTSPSAPLHLPTAKPSATATAAVTPTPTAPGGPTATPTATAVASATVAPTVTPVVTPTPTVAPTVTPTAAPTATAQPEEIHVGFTHAATTDPVFGPIAFYSPTTGNAAIITVVHGSQVIFTNDGTVVPHTGSGLGTGPFPAAFDNTSGTTQSGTTIDGSLTWSTGTLAPGGSSQVFTVGAPGHYYFGCFYHFDGDGMQDVLVST
jgi:plastocyanin